MAIKIGELTLFSLNDIQEKIGIAPQTARKYIAAGELKARKVGSKWFITEQALKEFFESGNLKGTPGRPKKQESRNGHSTEN